MNKYVKVIYEYYRETNGKIEVGLRSALAPFCEQNTTFVDGIGYSDNLERFIQETFECGYLFLTPDHIVTVLQLKAFFAHSPKEEKTEVEEPSKVQEKGLAKKPNRSNRSNRRRTPKVIITPNLRF